MKASERRAQAETRLTMLPREPVLDPRTAFSKFPSLMSSENMDTTLCKICHYNLNKTGNMLLSCEITQAVKYWIAQSQKQAFPKPENDATLLRLNPKKNEDGLLRMDGRSRLANELPYDTKHPILLPKKHPVTKLIVMEIHKSLGHGIGVKFVLTQLRSRFLVIKKQKTFVI